MEVRRVLFRSGFGRTGRRGGRGCDLRVRAQESIDIAVADIDAFLDQTLTQDVLQDLLAQFCAIAVPAHAACLDFPAQLIDAHAIALGPRTDRLEDGRVGKGCVSTFRYRW